MNKLIPAIFFALIANVVFGQITYETTYNGYTGIVDLTNSGCKFYVAEKQTETLKLYNLDHSLWKTINLDIPAGYELLNVYHVAEMLYSLDGTVACSYSCFNTNPSIDYISQVIDENGNVLVTIQDATIATPWDACDEGAKLIALITDYTPGNQTAKVYGLPGNIYASVNSNNMLEFQHAFPNPSNSTVTIPYTLPDEAESGELIFLNSQGQEISNYPLNKKNEKIQINTGQWVPGIYLYQVKTEQSVSETYKLIVH